MTDSFTFYLWNLYIPIVVAAVWGVALYFILFKGKAGRNKFPIIVHILESRSGNNITDTDFARRIEDVTKGTVIQLKKRKKKLPPIPLDFFTMDKRGRSILFLSTPDNEKYFPIRPRSGFDPRFLEEKAWDLVDYRTAVRIVDLFLKQSFFEKYKGILMVLIFGMIIIIGSYLIIGEIGEAVVATQEGNRIAQQNLASTKELTKALIQALDRVQGEDGKVSDQGPNVPPPY